MESGRFEDVFSIKHGDIPASYVGLPQGTVFARRISKMYLHAWKGARFMDLRHVFFPATY